MLICQCANYPIKCQYTNSEMHQFVLYPLHSAAYWHIATLAHYYIGTLFLSLPRNAPVPADMN